MPTAAHVKAAMAAYPVGTVVNYCPGAVAAGNWYRAVVLEAPHLHDNTDRLCVYIRKNNGGTDHIRIDHILPATAAPDVQPLLDQRDSEIDSLRKRLDEALDRNEEQHRLYQAVLLFAPARYLLEHNPGEAWAHDAARLANAAQLWRRTRDRQSEQNLIEAVERIHPEEP